MTATYEQRTPAQVKRLQDAEQEGRLAGAEFENLRSDLTWDPDNWTRLIEQIQANPYESCESAPDVPAQELASLHARWAKAFDLGQHAQQAENQRKGTVA